MMEKYIDYAAVARKLSSINGFTLFPLKGKVPAVRNWKRYIGVEQKKWEINKLFNRYTITGFAVVLDNDLRAFDLDKTNDRNDVNAILRQLDLPQDYKYVVRTGNGYHIYFYCTDKQKLIKRYFGGEKSYYLLKMRSKYKAERVELRWSNCYMVGPYSIHPSGKQYEFINGEPSERATKIKPVELLKALKVMQVPEKNLVIKKAENAKGFDRDLILSVTNYLRKIKLNYQEWIDCGFAYCSIGLEGKKYFIILSINEFYPKDTERSVSKKFNELLIQYKGSKITLGTLFHIAKKYGYKMPIKKSKRKAEFLEYELCVLSYPEKEEQKLLIMIRHYAMVEKIYKEFMDKNDRLEELKKLAKRLQVYDGEKIVIRNHKFIKNYVDEFVCKYGEQPYCRIGANFFREVIQDKFDTLTFRILCSITAVQGKKSKWKIISKERMKAAILGYKSLAVFTSERKVDDTPSDYQIRGRAKNLRAKHIISYITLFRNTYYSTFLTQKQLGDIAEERYNENYLNKLESDSFENEFKKNMKKNKKNIEKKFFEKIKPKLKIKYNANDNYVN